MVGPPPADDIGRKRETPMNSTPIRKKPKPRDAQTGRADERLAHAHEEIKRADEQLTRMSEQLAKMERDAARPAFGRTCPGHRLRQRRLQSRPPTQVIACAMPPPQAPPARPALPDPVGLLLAACFVVTALVFVGLWRRGQAGCHPLGAAARFNAIIAAGRSNACRAVRAIHRSSGRGGDSTTANGSTAQATPPQATSLAQAQTAPQDAAPAACRSRLLRSNPVAANDRARSRDSGAEHRTAQGEPAANGQRQFKSHWGAQGQPGRDETHAREGFRADPAQGVTASDAAGSGLAQARADVSAAAGESAASILPEGSGSTTIGSRRRGDRRNPVRQQRDRARSRDTARVTRATSASIFTSLLCSPHPTCQFRKAGAACSHG